MYNFGVDLIDQITAEYILGSIIVFILVVLSVRFKRGRKNHKYYSNKWKELQKNCKDKENWRLAITQADDLLAEALKTAKVKGETTGERLVSAQKIFSENEEVWIAHKLRVKLDEHPNSSLKKSEVKKSLLAFGRALKDLEVM